ncbi:hypothetical protein HK405_012097 [Cladochytrium tenue]|nr:hypothetical protein HK405_012097 [Cladochytrium tenue]
MIGIALTVTIPYIVLLFLEDMPESRSHWRNALNVTVAEFVAVLIYVVTFVYSAWVLDLGNTVRFVDLGGWRELLVATLAIGLCQPVVRLFTIRATRYYVPLTQAEDEDESNFRIWSSMMLHLITYETFFLYPGRLLIWRSPSLGDFLLVELLNSLLQAATRLLFAWLGRLRLHRLLKLIHHEEGPMSSLAVEGVSSLQTLPPFVSEEACGGSSLSLKIGCSKIGLNKSAHTSEPLPILQPHADDANHIFPSPGAKSDSNVCSHPLAHTSSPGIAMSSELTAAAATAALTGHTLRRVAGTAILNDNLRLTFAFRQEQAWALLAENTAETLSRVGALACTVCFVTFAPWAECYGTVDAVDVAIRAVISTAVYVGFSVPTVCAMHWLVDLDIEILVVPLNRGIRAFKPPLMAALITLSFVAIFIASEANMLRPPSPCFLPGRLLRS